MSDSLDEYRHKRDFRKTVEPRGGDGGGSGRAPCSPPYPRFEGLRHDKDPEGVVRERPA